MAVVTSEERFRLYIDESNKVPVSYWRGCQNMPTPPEQIVIKIFLNELDRQCQFAHWAAESLERLLTNKEEMHASQV